MGWSLKEPFVKMQKKRVGLLVGLLLIVLAGSLCLFLPGRPSGPLASGKLADGRILQVEGVTFGRQHRMGRRSLVEPLQPWLPGKVAQFFAPPYPANAITLDEPGLVVWVNALDPATGKHVDCQRIRVEFVDDAGELFGQATSSWFGGTAFWRVGHVFYAFPRTQRTLTLQVSCWKKPDAAIRMQLPNPCVSTPAAWQAGPLPQRRAVRDLEVELSSLALRTNGGPKEYWQTPSFYWEPAWKLRRNGAEASGWDLAKWTAADPTGNQGKFLGTRQPLLRFSAEFYPSATNLSDSLLLGRLPELAVPNLQSNAWRDLTLTNGTAQLTVLGFRPAGMYIFTEGRYETNPAAASMGPTRGGAPSGWVGQSRRISPGYVKQWHGHYTPVPVVYIHTPALGPKERLGLRLRDEQGRCWLAQPEPEGPADGVWPFLVSLPADVARVSGEVVLLKPLQAEFTVRTDNLPAAVNPTTR
jgi:hypothetical protein